MNDSSKLFALLVGINKYHPRGGVPTLRGCVADVDAMEQILKQKFGVPQANILKLTNQEATHARIKEAFRTHLIEQGQTLQAAGQADAASFFFHYSGHGSQAIDESGEEPDGWDETLVPYDSRTPGIFDVKDWELGKLINDLHQASGSNNITILLDCCHSGSGTRALDPATLKGKRNVVQTRRCAPDTRPQPTQRPAQEQATRSVRPAGWETGAIANHVLLAGCRDREESNEHPLSEGGKKSIRGALSYFLLEELARLPAGSPPTYSELHERVRLAVNSRYPDQMPQCEGAIDRPLFGGAEIARDAFFTVQRAADGYFWIDGGIAHGLRKGSQLKVYAPETRTHAEAQQELATLEIMEEGAVQSGCQVVAGQNAVPILARCLVDRLKLGDMQRKVLLEIADSTLRDQVKARLGKQPATAMGIDVAAWVKVVGEKNVADFRVVQRVEQLEIQDNSGKLLVAPFKFTSLDGLAADLAHLARYQNGLALRNDSPDSDLAGKVKLTLKRLAFDPATQAPVAAEFAPTPGGEWVVETDSKIIFELTNQSEQPLYLALLNFSADWGVYQLYPDTDGAHEQLAPGKSISIGLSKEKAKQLEVQLPEDWPAEATESREILKVIATVADANFENLQQGALKSPFGAKRTVRGARGGTPSALDQLFTHAMNGTRAGFRAPKTTADDEWTTTQLVITNVRPQASSQLALTGGQTTTLTAFQLTVEPPAGFQGKLSVLPTRTATRSVADLQDDERAIKALAAFGNVLQPLGIGSTRATINTGAALAIETDDASRALITPQTPLTLQLGWEQDAGTAGVIALAYDGTFFYPVGRQLGDDQTLRIESLPASDPEGEELLPTRRSIGRTVKLYLYKLLKWQEPSLGLHSVRFVPNAKLETDPAAADEQVRAAKDGELRYTPAPSKPFKPGARIALVVHGFTAETNDMAAFVTRDLPEHGVRYDHVLAFDYETFNTHITENGKMLANALRAVGFDQADQLHLDVIAHSMGTLVTRTLIEQWGGDAFVDRAFLCGPPNQGTRLADVKRLIPWLSTLMVNNLAAVPVAALAGWALNKASDDGVGPEDLRPSSQIINDINDSSQPLTVKYHLLAGQNNMPPQERNAWERLRGKVMHGVDVGLDAIFGDQNDMVINVKSMRGLRNGHYPDQMPEPVEVPCNHFQYFSTSEAQEQLVKWLKG